MKLSIAADAKANIFGTLSQANLAFQQIYLVKEPTAKPFIPFMVALIFQKRNCSLTGKKRLEKFSGLCPRFRHFSRCAGFTSRGSGAGFSKGSPETGNRTG